MTLSCRMRSSASADAALGRKAIAKKQRGELCHCHLLSAAIMMRASPVETRHERICANGLPLAGNYVILARVIEMLALSLTDSHRNWYLTTSALRGEARAE